MNEKTDVKPKYKIGQHVYYIHDEHKVKKYKVSSIRICVTKHILNSPFMEQSDTVDIFYCLVNEHGYSVKHSWDFHELALYGDEYDARMAARRYINDDIISLNERMKKIKKIAQTNNSRIGKLEKKGMKI